MNKLLVLSLVLVSITAITEDVKSDLFGENEASKNYFDSFKMYCRQQTTQCIERKLAIDAENSFNDIFIISLDRAMQVWPNGEPYKLKDALALRKDADFDFGDGYFVNAERLYVDAIEVINKVLDEADIIVRENLEIGEQYLYEDGKPGWAAPYFNDSLIYDPNNKRISKGLSRIRFLQSFKDDVVVIKDYLETDMYQDALGLIEDLIAGDPGNAQLLELRRQASQGEVGIKISDQTLDFNIALNESITIQDKKEIISKIDNALSVYGSDESTTEMQDLKKEIGQQVFDELFNDLQENFINNSRSTEDLYNDSKNLLSLYPRNREVKILTDKIIEKRNSSILEALYSASEDLRLEESWKKALIKHKQIYQITKSIDDSNIISSLEMVIKRIDSIEAYSSDPASYLNNFEKIDDAKWLLTEAQKLSDSKTQKLNQTILDFETLISTYEVLVIEDNKNNKNNKNKNSTPKKLNLTKDNTPKSNPPETNNKSIDVKRPDSSSTSLSSKAQLDMNSFIQNVACTKPIRNKPITALYEIRVTTSGTAQTVVLLNVGEIKMSSRDREVVNIVTESLRNSKYKPAKSGDVFVSTTITKRLKIPSNFCS